MLESLWKQYSQNEHSVNDDMKRKKKASVELSSLFLAPHYFKYQSRFGFKTHQMTIYSISVYFNDPGKITLLLFSMSETLGLLKYLNLNAG